MLKRQCCDRYSKILLYLATWYWYDHYQDQTSETHSLAVTRSLYYLKIKYVVIIGSEHCCFVFKASVVPTAESSKICKLHIIHARRKEKDTKVIKVTSKKYYFCGCEQNVWMIQYIMCCVRFIRFDSDFDFDFDTYMLQFFRSRIL